MKKNLKQLVMVLILAIMIFPASVRAEGNNCFGDDLKGADQEAFSTLTFPVICSWICIVVGLSMVWMLAPVENINRELDQNEKEHCKKVTEKTISGILVFAIFCTLGRFLEMVSLVAMTVLLVLISQCIGVLKFKIEKNVYSRE